VLSIGLLLTQLPLCLVYSFAFLWKWELVLRFSTYFFVPFGFRVTEAFKAAGDGINIFIKQNAGKGVTFKTCISWTFGSTCI